MSPGPAARRRGSGALLAFCAIGIVVMSIMVFSQGYLAGALSQTDAVLAGRQAEYLADGAIAEALLRLQEARNSEFTGLFQGGSSFGIDPELTGSLALSGMSVDTVMFSLGDSQDFHGDGRGFYGTVAIEATVGVPRRVARAAGISAYRTVRHHFEYKGVLQGPPAEFADKMLYAQEMRGLPEMKLWYEEDLQGAWEEVRVETQEAIEEDAQEVVDTFEDFATFAGDAANLLQRLLEWPGLISGFGAAGVTQLQYDLNPDVRVNDVIPFNLGSPRVDEVIVRLNRDGGIIGYGEVCLGVCAGTHRTVDPFGDIPAAKPIITDVLDKAIRQAVEAVLPAGLASSPEDLLDQLRQIAAVDTSEFLEILNGGDYPLPELVRDVDWPPFRTDAEPLSEPAYVLGARGEVSHDELLLDPPRVPSEYPDSPLNDDAFAPYRSFDPVRWRDVMIREVPPLAPMQLPFAVYPEKWRLWFDPYLQDWDEELRRLEDVIRLGEQPDTGLLQPDYWAAMAAYEFPDTATGLAYIEERWGQAGAVYRFASDGAISLAGMRGHGTFTTFGGGSLSLSGSGSGSHTVVAGSVTMDGAARAAIFSADEPVRFDGASVTGLVAAAGLQNIGRDELDPFTITYDPMEGDLTFSVCEYPVAVVVSRE